MDTDNTESAQTFSESIKALKEPSEESDRREAAVSFAIEWANLGGD